MQSEEEIPGKPSPGWAAFIFCMSGFSPTGGKPISYLGFDSPGNRLLL
jgi:hypothetical protein